MYWDLNPHHLSSQALAYHTDIILACNRGCLSCTPKCPSIIFPVLLSCHLNRNVVPSYIPDWSHHPYLEAHSSSDHFLYYQEPSATLYIGSFQAKDRPKGLPSNIKTRENNSKQKPVSSCATPSALSCGHNLYSLLPFIPSMNYTYKSCLTHTSPSLLAFSYQFARIQPCLFCAQHSAETIHTS